MIQLDRFGLGPRVTVSRNKAARAIRVAHANLRYRPAVDRERPDRDPTAIYLPEHGFNSSEYQDGRCSCTMRTLDVRGYDAKKEQTRDGGGKLGKIRGTMGYGDKSPSILLGRSFQVLVSETSVFGVFPASGRTGKTAWG